MKIVATIAVLIVLGTGTYLYIYNKSPDTSLIEQVNKNNPMNSYLPDLSQTTIEIDGKEVSFEKGTFAPVLHLGDVKEEDLNTSSPVQTLALYYHLLAQGDIDAASKITNAPEKTKTSLTNYSERIGTDVFKKNYTEGFSGSNKISVRDIVRIEDIVIVFLKTNEYSGANPLVLSGDSYILVEDTSILSEDVKVILQYLTEKLNS